MESKIWWGMPKNIYDCQQIGKNCDLKGVGFDKKTWLRLQDTAIRVWLIYLLFVVLKIINSTIKLLFRSLKFKNNKLQNEH